MTNHYLDSSRVADEGRRHLEASGRDVTHCSLDVVGDPGDFRVRFSSYIRLACCHAGSR